MAPTSVAVVGAGIVGCLTAAEIASRSPGTSVTVLERDAIGSGASRRSAGLHLPRGASERVRRMSAYSQQYYDALAPTLPPGMLFPVAVAIVAGRESAGRLRETHLPAARLRPTNVDSARLLPWAAGTEAWTIEGSHYADVQGLSEVVAERLRPLVSFREGVRVTRVEPAEDHVLLHLGTGERLRVDRAVLVPGPWVDDPAWGDLLAPLRLRVKKVVAIHIEMPPEDGDEAVVFPDEDAFLLPLRHRGHWLFSYTCDEWDVDPDGLHEGLSASNVAAASDCLRRYSPQLAELCLSGRVFCDAYSPDREPVVQVLDNHGRVVFAGAANGSGYRLAPAMAAEVAELLDLPSDARSLG